MYGLIDRGCIYVPYGIDTPRCGVILVYFIQLLVFE